MPVLESVRGIILRKTRYSESDLILSVLLQSGEKRSLMARGALKSKKRFAGGILEPTHFLNLQCRNSNQGELWILEEASLVEDFIGIRKDYSRLEVAFEILEVVQRISMESVDESGLQLFNILGNALKNLSKSDSDYAGIHFHFLVKILQQQGVLELEASYFPWLRSPIGECKEAVDLYRLQQLKNDVKAYSKVAML